MIGHYERVREFNENKNIINEKLIAALDANIIPILCFGEDIDEDYKEVIPNLLNSYLKNIMNIFVKSPLPCFILASSISKVAKDFVIP